MTSNFDPKLCAVRGEAFFNRPLTSQETVVLEAHRKGEKLIATAAELHVSEQRISQIKRRLATRGLLKLRPRRESHICRCHCGKRMERRD